MEYAVDPNVGLGELRRKILVQYIFFCFSYFLPVCQSSLITDRNPARLYILRVT